MTRLQDRVALVSGGLRANAACFLACDDSSYCTGSDLVADGGWTAH